MNCLKNNNINPSISDRNDIQQCDNSMERKHNQRRNEVSAHFNNITKVTSIQVIQVNDEDLQVRGENIHLRFIIVKLSSEFLFH